MKCKYCNGELIPLGETGFCEFCRKEFHIAKRIDFLEQKREEKKQVKNKAKKKKGWMKGYRPNGFKTVCSSANYNREPILKGGLVRPR